MPILKSGSVAVPVAALIPGPAQQANNSANAIIGAQAPRQAGGSQGGSSGGSGLGSMTASGSSAMNLSYLRQQAASMPAVVAAVAQPTTADKVMSALGLSNSQRLHMQAAQGAAAAAAAAGVAYNGMLGPAAVPLAGSGGTLSDTSPTQGRRQNLGFPTTTINILATTTLTSAPQVYFRPDRLFIASATGASFTVSNIEVGNKQQFVNSNPCPAAMFSELAVNADVEYDTCAPAVSIAVQMTSINTSVSVASTPGMTGRSAY